jgi:hypothetical protein
VRLGSGGAILFTDNRGRGSVEGRGESLERTQPLAPPDILADWESHPAAAFLDRQEVLRRFSLE